MNVIFGFVFSAVPLLLASTGALFSEYAGILAVFIDGVINLSAFLTFAFFSFTQNIFISAFLSILSCVILVLVFSLITEKLKLNPFLAATAMNLLFSSFTSFLSWIFFKTRGVLVSESFRFAPATVNISGVAIALLLALGAILFLFKTPYGMYLRITGSDEDVLEVKGISSSLCRIAAWELSAFFAAVSGIMLCLKLNSFVPNISAGRGWIALAAVFIGQKKLWKILLAVIIFCAFDMAGITLQKILPSTAMNALPYFTALILISFSKGR